ncbi:aldo-keto reductase family 1 member C15-like isoform X3 [Mixophyes fleayi]|uniref:aldo-keto reductase family 1 member C15-like isoform X3 n=1 Tax=Mixophyes fleayi TaxID=3061075 RepID=UPI003F4E34EB
MDLHAESFLVMNDGQKIPVIGFGTYAPEECPKGLAEEATRVAIEVGYRHIDCAYIYGNEAEVGRAIRAKIADGTVRREDLFYTGKLWSTFHAPALVRPALEESLQNLQLEYMDLFIIHLPLGMKPGDDPFPMDENGQLIFHHSDLRDTWEVECHIYLSQRKLLEFCRSHDIVLVGYSVLGSSRDNKWIDQHSPVVLEDKVLVAIAGKHNKSPAQVALRYFLQLGAVVLAKSFNPTRIKDNFQVFDFHLSPEDLKALESLNRNYRYVAARQWINHPEYPFHDEY